MKNQVSRSLLLLPLLALPLQSIAATITYQFESVITSLESDGGLSLPGGVEVGSTFTGQFSYSTDWVYIGNFDTPFADAGVFMLANSMTFTVGVQVGDTYMEAVSETLAPPNPQPNTYVLGFDNSGGSDLVAFLHDSSPGGNGYRPSSTAFGEIDVTFSDSTASFIDSNLVAGSFPSSGWEIPLDAFDAMFLNLAFFETKISDDVFADYVKFRGDITSISEVPLPAAAPLFAVALMSLFGLKRAGTRKA